jgi:carbon starvation protein
LIGEQNLPFAITFGAMAFSTFVFDTLDVCTRLGRYIIQEIFHWPGKLGAVAATLITVAVPVYFVASSLDAGWRGFWTLFGASNQLLAALTLLAISVWLYKARRRIAFTLLPMLFVLTITLWALGKLTLSNFTSDNQTPIMIINGIASLSLILLAVYLVIKGLMEAKRGKRDATDFLSPEKASISG